METHAGRKSTLDSMQNPGEIEDIPDLDGPGDVTNGVAGLNLGGDGGSGVGGKDREVSEIPDLDDIPDMEEELEDEDEATAAPRSKPAPVAPTAGTNTKSSVIDARFVPLRLL